MISKILNKTAVVIFALTGSLVVSSCVSSDPLRAGYLSLGRETIAPPPNPVIVVPGFAHTRLYDPVINRYVWGSAHSMMIRRFPDDFELPIDPATSVATRDRLVPRGFVGSRSLLNPTWRVSRMLHRVARYGAPSEDPSKLTNVYLFAYDWRLSHVDNANGLDRFIDAVRRTHSAPELQVDLLTLSDGGTVAQAFLRFGQSKLDDDDATRARLSAEARGKIRRIVMLAPPAAGTLEAVRLLNDKERFVLRLLTPEASATFPSLPELFPLNGRVFMSIDGEPLDLDLWDVESWKKLDVSVFGKEGGDEAFTASFQRSLERGRKFRALLETLTEEELGHIEVIASDCIPTAKRIIVNKKRLFFYAAAFPAESAARRFGFTDGDGSITTSSATSIASAPTLVCDGHLFLSVDPTVQRAIVRALTQTPDPSVLTGNRSGQPSVR